MPRHRKTTIHIPNATFWFKGDIEIENPDGSKLILKDVRLIDVQSNLEMSDVSHDKPSIEIRYDK